MIGAEFRRRDLSDDSFILNSGLALPTDDKGHSGIFFEISDFAGALYGVKNNFEVGRNGDADEGGLRKAIRADGGEDAEAVRIEEGEEELFVHAGEDSTETRRINSEK